MEREAVMKEIVKTIYVSFDGKEFGTKAEASSYEDERIDQRIAGLTVEQIRAALSYADPDLSDALEFAGDICRERRKAAGVLRRKPATRAAPNGSEATGAPADATGGGERDLLGTES
jgi:hypothetical protein